MDPRRPQNNGMSYSNLFNLEPLMKFQLPQPEGDTSNSTQEESTSSQGHGYSNGGTMGKRQSVEESSDEDGEEYDTRISEKQYRTMLGEHVQKYRNTSAATGAVRTAMPVVKRHNGSRPVKEDMRLREVDRSPGYLEEEFESEYGGSSRFSSGFESAYLDIGEGITYRIPPTYDKLAASLKLPNYSDIRVDEYFLSSELDLRSLSAFLSSDKKFEARNRGGLAEPQTQYESLQARLRALATSSSNQKFPLVVTDLGLDTIPEGAAGKIRRSIMSESGNLQVYYVKVLEKGDTYEIVERSLPKKQEVKKDAAAIEKEEIDKMGKIWVSIVRRDVPRHHRTFYNLHKRRSGDAKRFSEMCQREVKLKVSRSIKLMRGAAIRTKKLARDMLLFWKRVDKEQAEQRKKDEKEAAERLKREQELREARRQQQSLNFLISQTELYSHFMQNKSIGQSSDAVADGDAPEGTLSTEDVDLEDENEIEEARIRRQAALEVAQRAVLEQQKITNNFDSDTSKLREAGEAAAAANDSAITGSTNIDLLNPSTMPTTSSVQTPELFKGTLKEYQLKGLQWLVNCYEKGLNGILADEMGLGKTIQAMAFLAHLAEEKDIWGPFLVVAPSSVLNNWADEISRFIPDLKTLPYWGGLPERNILRKNINPKRLYRRNAGFHILITSYQLIVSDEKYLRRVKWQYMVLDEAQAIKSSSSIRWKTLLSFNCRNRLLLTGTPIQNNMAELWALLHFIMPTLFNSHEQFNEWFSKGIESHAEHGGTLNEHQLNRLHAVLKPFMLRRVKKDVITEMTSKTEVTVHCKLSSRQQQFYRAIRDKISLAEFIDNNRGHLNEKKIVNLMNIVIQLRKVCNHPELFERNEGTSYYYFAEVRNSLLPPPFGELEDIYYSGYSNPIEYKVPKLIHEEFLRNTEMPCSVKGHGLERNTFERLFNIFSPDNIFYSSILRTDKYYTSDASFEFTRLLDLSPAEVSFLAKGSLLDRLLFSVIRLDRQFVDETVDLFMDMEGNELRDNHHLEESKVKAVARMLLLPTKSEASILRRKLATVKADAPYEPLVIPHQERFITNIRLLRSLYAYIPQARAPQINVHCSDRSFAYQMVEQLHNPWVKKQFLGFARISDFNGPRMPIDPHYLVQERGTESDDAKPMLQLTYRIFGSSPPVRSFDPAKMLTDSGKLQTLDILLRRLRAGNHRVLLFAQMTKMLNIIEDYMNYRKYKYLRLDGSSNINDRRDMVRDFQHRNDIFVFLLSTRAGGLGINLTAADTVIFYESDWNPTLDLQAMDRAHRLGQTKEVTVYRLICKETVEEKILQRASQKNTVQQLVMTGGHVQGDLMKAEDVFSLIMDDAQLEKMREIPLLAKERQKKKRPSKGIRVDADGVVSLEDLDAPAAQVADPESVEQQNATTNKKRKSKSESSRNHQKSGRNDETGLEMNESILMGDDEQQRPSRSKRPKKSVNENLDSAINSSAITDHNQEAPYDY